MRRFTSFVFVLALFTPVLLLGACSTTKESKPADQQPVAVLYNKAAKAMDSKDYKKAAKGFDDVERLYPYSEWATRAQLMGAYALYQSQQYDESVIALDRYMELHPGNKDIDYALYLKALCYYEQISDVARDQKMTEMALDSLQTLISRYPNSLYTRDAILKRDLTLDHLAGKEMEIGRYYLNRGDLNAALNRFRTVIKKYQTTTHVPEALERMVEVYVTLGLKDEALRTAAVLGYNYPGSKWYQDAYRLMDPKQREQLIKNQSFVDKTINTLLKPE